MCEQSDVLEMLGEDMAAPLTPVCVTTQLSNEHVMCEPGHLGHIRLIPSTSLSGRTHAVQAEAPRSNHPQHL